MDLNTSNEQISASPSPTSETDQEETDGDDILHWGERLPDDLINTFCDRLSETTSAVEGFFAIQSIMLELDRRPTEISGRKQVLQIILDQSQSHFVLLEWKPENRCVHVYDSLMPDCRGLTFITTGITQDIRQQIVALFGHLSCASIEADGNNNSDEMLIIVERGIQLQEDNWSCGLRAIGHLLLRMFDQNVEEFDVDLRDVLNFFLQTLENQEPTIDHFREADFAQQRNVPRKNRLVSFLLVKETLQIRAMQFYRRQQ